ncbi:dihydrodipicolinate synthase family protein [Paraglaciecola sp.]|uniref:dihydrodipicolinate synthase family protein n=1 Tax=Paraglaciecola sp. TaxID=1920173 RepID=UPI0030F488C2
MFTGLSAFPITPFSNEVIDFKSFEALIGNLTQAKVDSICAAGSTGLYPYLNRKELSQVAKATVEMAGNIPVMAGIGSLRTLDVLKNAEAVQQAGVSAVLLAPMSYHRLNDSEVYSLFDKVTAELSVPLCVYENPGATNFTFSNELYAEVTKLKNVAAIKIPGMPFETEEGDKKLAQLRELLPEHVAIGVSADKFAAAGMASGCDLWFSVLGGLFPKTVQAMILAAKTQTRSEAMAASSQFDQVWQLFARNRGGMRVMATAADILGYTEYSCIPEPLQPLIGEDRAQLELLLKQLQLG